MKAPSPKKIAKSLVKHSDERIDFYYWMNNREDREVINHLKKENLYCEQVLKHTKPLQHKIYREIVGRIKPNDDSTPYLFNEYFYQYRYLADQDHPIYYRRHQQQEIWEILLDAQEMSKDHSYFKVGSLQASPDNHLLAYSTDTQGRRQYTIYLKDLDESRNLEDTIEMTTGGIAWADSRSFFYTKKDPKTLRPFQVWYHVLGKKEDQLVYEERDESFYTYAYRSKTGKYIIISSHSTISSEYHLIPTSDPTSIPRVFNSREDHHEYEIFDADNEFLIRTNWKAKNFCIMKCNPDKTEKSYWETCLPASEDTFYEDVEVVKDYVAVLSRANAVPSIRIYDRNFEDSDIVEFPEMARMLYFTGNREFSNSLIRLAYCSLTTPYSTYDYDPWNGNLNLLKRQEVLGGYLPEEYFSERILVDSHDGLRVPVSLVYRKDMFKPGQNPCLLYGYGSYGHSIDPYFSIPRISLLDRGFVFAIAHIRGGQELGRNWYEQGKLMHKKNTFADFVACGKAMVERNYVAPDKLCGMGGSAGGLLIGAVMNQAPELWRAMVAAVPFVDVVTTMMDESIPLTTGEYNEWGNPNEEDYYQYIKSYSPYDNIENKDYPALLATTGLHDSQVQYWEPAKWVAKLREHNTSDLPIVFYTNMEAGHSGKAGRFEQHHETAMEWAFLIDQTTDL